MVSKDEVINEIKKLDRVCPMPPEWDALYKILIKRTQKGVDQDPPVPLILAAWHTPALMKMIILEEQILWAEDKGILNEVYDFLCSLDESNWLHLGQRA